MQRLDKLPPYGCCLFHLHLDGQAMTSKLEGARCNFYKICPRAHEGLVVSDVVVFTDQE